MKPILISKNGFNLRCLKCTKCNETLVHPVDKQEYENFITLKKKDFAVKMRMVGNSYAVSIPREIVDFMREQENMINDMVRLSFDNANRLSLMFDTPNSQINENNRNENTPIQSRVVKAKEVKIVRNNKPIFHARQFSDSAHPERNKIKVYKAKKLNQFEEENEEDGR